MEAALAVAAGTVRANMVLVALRVSGRMPVLSVAGFAVAGVLSVFI